MTIAYGGISSEVPTQSNRLFDVTDVVFLTKPDEAPLTALLTSMRQKSAGDNEFKWFNKGIRSQKTLINDAGAYTAVDTELTVDAADIFVPQDVVQVVDKTTGVFGEQMIITAVDTANNKITVIRGVGSTAAVIADDDILLRTGNAHSEGSDLPVPMSQKLVEYENYAQIFRHSARYTRSALSTTFRAGNQSKEVVKKRVEKTREHKREIEAALLWGQKARLNAGLENVRRTMDGMQAFLDISTAAGNDHQQAAGGTLTEPEFEGFLESKGFAFGGKEKWALCSPGTITVINDLKRGAQRLENLVTEFGLNILRWESPHGVLNIVRHELFDTGLYANAMLVFDPDHLELRHLEGAITMFTTDVGEARFDRFEDSWLSEVGLQVAVPESLALLTGITTAG